jgi:hypothetical protein
MNSLALQEGLPGREGGLFKTEEEFSYSMYVLLSASDLAAGLTASITRRAAAWKSPSPTD